ncbi:pseudouridine synthase [Mongoliitalea daihaiensis]|nr:pseudouridine synthase [Mongoliitalea daihaiensis]UJP66087.1 pseudouridine synthase [Mongoliitalea daihaiensis]
MKRDNNKRPSGDGQGRRGSNGDSAKRNFSKSNSSDKRFSDRNSNSKKSDSLDQHSFFKKKAEGQENSYPKTRGGDEGESKKPYGKSSEKKTYGRASDRSNDGKKSFSKSGESKSYGSSDDKKPFGRTDEKKSYGRSDAKKTYSKSDGDKPYGRSDEKKNFSRSDEKKPYGKSGERKTYGRSDDKKSFGRTDEKKTEEGKSYSASRESKSYGDKPSFKKDGTVEKPEGKAVYRGRGKDEKPVFDWVPKDDSSTERPRKKRFKNPFEKGAPSERPEYNFERLEKNHNREKKSDDIRLNKYISNSGICSRREADELITKGEVKVNGQVITELGYKVALTDKVTYKGKLINPEKPVYLLLNKPKDFITTTEDPMERKTVMHLVSNACEERVFPVGRLDRNTTGLLLFTNDGELAAKLSHPSNQIKKIYQVTLDKPITKGDEEAILEGLTLEDGEVQVDDMQVLSKDRTILGLEIHVGKNRIVRRIFAHLGYEVIGLDRVMYAGLDKKDLPRGRYRFLSEKEVIRLKFFL